MIAVAGVTVLCSDPCDPPPSLRSPARVQWLSCDQTPAQ